MHPRIEIINRNRSGSMLMPPERARRKLLEGLVLCNIIFMQQ